MLVYLNPGHDLMKDPGAVNDHLQLTEATLANHLGWAVKDRLEEEGIRVRKGQSDYLFDICNDANRCGADLFVSLHFNAFNGHATGTETLVSYTPESVILGQNIQSRLCNALELPDRGIKERMELLVIRATIMPAVLVETCFIDNDHDIERYFERKDEVADAIAQGILAYPGCQQMAA